MFTKIKRWLFLMIITVFIIYQSACTDYTTEASESNGEEYKTITDMAGRTVEVPEDIESVYSTGQPGVVAIYTLCPDKLLGWCIEPADAEEEFINAKYLSLPVLGLSQGSNANASTEEIIARDPDIILYMTDLTADDVVSAADELEEQFQIPVVVVGYELTELDETYEFLGELLDEEERAAELAEYCREIIDEVEEVASTISDEDKVTVYYAQGSTGLQTAPLGSSHSQVIDMVGGINVCELEATESGRLTIDMEQLFEWDPDVIITSYSAGHSGTDIGNTDVFEVIANANPEWELLEAVQDGEIFATPCLPYNWLDMPPSANRIIGVVWLAELLYPEYYSFDTVQEVKDFYELFYQIELTDDEIDMLLENAVR